MGNIASVLFGSNSGSSSSDSKIPSVNINFEHAPPSIQEREIYARLSEILKSQSSLLDSLKSYNGCEEIIREAISNPSPKNEKTAWAAVQPAVGKLKRFYEYSASLEDTLPELLDSLSQPHDSNIYQILEQKQALSKLLSDVLEFTLQFDYLKMQIPSIQNDFSYYRRTLSRGKLDHQTDIKTAMVEDELASRISLFYAHPCPMLKTVTDIINLHMAKSNNSNNILQCLAGLAGAAYTSMIKNRLSRPESIPYVLRVMTVSIILYDIIDPSNLGVFAKSSPINTRACIRLIQTSLTLDQQIPLLSAIKHSTKHLNDSSTPKNIKILLAST